MNTIIPVRRIAKRHRRAQDAFAVVLAGGRGTRLGALTREICKPALSFGGLCRNIDFSLSNCVNSGINRIAVATQYKDASLIRHLEDVWSAALATGERLVQPWRAESVAGAEGYRGTADAVYQNWAQIEALDTRLVLILAGDHVYKMDYRPLIRRHVTSGAGVSVGCVEVPIAEACQFGVMSVDREDRIVRFSEKPRNPESLSDRPERALASMGIYIFDTELLGQLLKGDAATEHSSHDFGRDLIPRLIRESKMIAYPFTKDAVVGGGYWRDIGTPSAYWRAHMEFLDGVARIDPEDPGWPVQSGVGNQQTLRSCSGLDGRPGHIINSLVGTDCETDQATIRRSVLIGNATVSPGTVLSNSVVLPDVSIGPDCRLNNVILGPGVQVPAGTVLASCAQDRTAEPTLISVDTDVFGISARRVRQGRGRPENVSLELPRQIGA